jgi:hypothetical protein
MLEERLGSIYTEMLEVRKAWKYLSTDPGEGGNLGYYSSLQKKKVKVERTVTKMLGSTYITGYVENDVVLGSTYQEIWIMREAGAVPIRRGNLWWRLR